MAAVFKPNFGRQPYAVEVSFYWKTTESAELIGEIPFKTTTVIIVKTFRFSVSNKGRIIMCNTKNSVLFFSLALIVLFEFVILN